MNLLLSKCQSKIMTFAFQKRMKNLLKSKLNLEKHLKVKQLMKRNQKIQSLIRESLSLIILLNMDMAFGCVS